MTPRSLFHKIVDPAGEALLKIQPTAPSISCTSANFSAEGPAEGEGSDAGAYRTDAPAAVRMPVPLTGAERDLMHSAIRDEDGQQIEMAVADLLAGRVASVVDASGFMAVSIRSFWRGDHLILGSWKSASGTFGDKSAVRLARSELDAPHLADRIVSTIAEYRAADQRQY